MMRAQDSLDLNSHLPTTIQRQQRNCFSQKLVGTACRIRLDRHLQHGQHLWNNEVLEEYIQNDLWVERVALPLGHCLPPRRSNKLERYRQWNSMLVESAV